MIHWIMLGIFCVSVAVLSLLHYCQRQVISGLELDLDYPGKKEHKDENVSDDRGIPPLR